MIENTLTSKCVESTSTSLAGEVIDIQFDVISELYSKFKSVLSVVEKNKEPFKTNYATREVMCCTQLCLPKLVFRLRVLCRQYCDVDGYICVIFTDIFDNICSICCTDPEN